MSVPHIWDAFMYNGEADILECRLVELESIPNLTHIVVEANVTHQDRPKPWLFLEEAERFAPWKDRIVHVKAKGLPPRTFDPDPWAREHAQREHIARALVAADPDDVLLQSDVDEIPTALAARNVRPTGYTAFQQRGHFWSLRWLYPHPWNGTVAARVGKLMQGGPRAFGYMRDVRNTAPSIPDAGWHLSWLPVGDLDSTDTAVKKVGAYCHPEVTDRINAGLAADNVFLREGRHVDGVQMTRCEVDDTFPKYVREGRCPESWLQ